MRSATAIRLLYVGDDRTAGSATESHEPSASTHLVRRPGWGDSLATASHEHPGLAVAATLVALAVASALLRSVLVSRVHGPFVFMDELGYERMAQSFAHAGHFSLFGKSGLAYSPLYPIVLSPIYALNSSMHTAYEWAKVENAVLISLSVFPVYGIARFVLSRRQSVAVAALALIAPLMLYSGFEMSESLAYPVCLLALWMMLRAVRSPTLANDALLVAAITLASAARLQLVVLGAAALTAILLMALARPETDSRLRALWRAVSEHRLLFVLAGATAIAALARTATNGGNLPLAGRYSNVGAAHASTVRVFELFFQHLAELDFAVGVIPFAAALLGLWALVRFRFPRRALVFASVATATTFWLLFETAFDAAAFDATSAHPRNRTVFTDLPRIHERYLIYLVPLFLVTLFLALGLRRTPFPASHQLVTVAVVASVLPALIPFATVVNGTTAIDSFALEVFGRKRFGETVPIAHAATLIVALSVLLALVFVLAMTQWLPPPAAVLVTALTLLGLSTLELGRQVTPIGRTELGLPSHADWVDRVVGSQSDVALIGGASVKPVALRETAFWNASISRVYYTCDEAFGTGFGEQRAVPGAEIRTRYAVVPTSFDLNSRVLAHDAKGKLALIAPVDGTVTIPSALGCRR